MNQLNNLSLKFLTALDVLYKKERQLEVEVVKKNGNKAFKYRIPLYSTNAGMSEQFAIRLEDDDDVGRWFELYENGNTIKIVSALYTNGLREVERTEFSAEEFYTEKHNGVDAVFILDNEEFKFKIHVELWGESLETSRTCDIPHGRHTQNRHYMHNYKILIEFAESISYNLLTARLLNKTNNEVLEFTDLYRSFSENKGRDDFGFHILPVDKTLENDKERTVDIFLMIWGVSFERFIQNNPAECFHKPRIHFDYWSKEKQERISCNFHGVDFIENISKEGVVYKFSDSDYELSIIVDFTKFKNEHTKDWYDARFAG
jgi:hypothetical protein